jgi:hypothetical protein
MGIDDLVADFVERRLPGNVKVLDELLFDQCVADDSLLRSCGAARAGLHN